jgi:hypothetical protein
MEIMNLENRCFNDFGLFYDEILNFRIALAYEPIFKYFSPHKFYSFFLKSDNGMRWNIICFWESRYKESLLQQLKPEIDFLKQLKLKIEKKITLIPNSGLTSILFKEFSNALKNSINKLENSGKSQVKD